MRRGKARTSLLVSRFVFALAFAGASSSETRSRGDGDSLDHQVFSLTGPGAITGLYWRRVLVCLRRPSRSRQVGNLFQTGYSLKRDAKGPQCSTFRAVLTRLVGEVPFLAGLKSRPLGGSL
jgi:hypothetical protein